MQQQTTKAEAAAAWGHRWVEHKGWGRGSPAASSVPPWNTHMDLAHSLQPRVQSLLSQAGSSIFRE